MLAIALSSASRSRVAMAASILRDSAGTASSTPLNWRCPSTNRFMSVSDATVAERGRRSSRASSPKYWPGPSVATLRLLRRTAASPFTMRKNSRPIVPCSQRIRPGGTETSSSARRMVRRSLADEVENSQIFERSRSLLMAANSSPEPFHVPVWSDPSGPAAPSDLGSVRQPDRVPPPTPSDFWPARSDGVGAAFTRAHPNHGLGRYHPYLAVTDLARGRRRDDGVHDRLGPIVLHEHLDAQLGHEVDLIFGTPVILRVASLAPVALCFGEGHA